ASLPKHQPASSRTHPPRTYLDACRQRKISSEERRGGKENTPILPPAVPSLSENSFSLRSPSTSPRPVARTRLVHTSTLAASAKSAPFEERAASKTHPSCRQPYRA